ncbi:MAG: hypothetical protein N4A35_05295 [Flavobacteriales bacterium]|nr:hypothetical protein [Flavobacteriales bacterium]
MSNYEEYKKQLTELMVKHHEMKTEFLKHIVVVSSAVLAVYTSLSNLHAHNICLHQALILLLLVSIVFATLGLYILIVQIRTLRKDAAEQIARNLLHVESEENRYISAKYEWMYKLCEYVSLTSFLVAVACLSILAL